MSVAPKLRTTKPSKAKQLGFSLIEIAMVLMIAGLVLGAGLRALGPQLEQRRYTQTQEQLQAASEALYGFFVLNRRLPCPASTTSGGREVFCSAVNGACVPVDPADPPPLHGRCVSHNNGFLPAATLGLLGMGQVGDTYPGLLPDAWGFPVRYAVSNAEYFAPVSGTPLDTFCDPIPPDPTRRCIPFTSLDGVRTAVARGPNKPESSLRVCSTSTGVTATECAAAPLLARPPFLLWSTGRRGPNLAAASADETKNRTDDPVFVSRPRDDGFDHLIFWQSDAQFFGRLSAQIN